MAVAEMSPDRCPVCGEPATYRDGYYFCHININHVVDEVFYKAGIERERKKLLGGDIKEYE